MTLIKPWFMGAATGDPTIEYSATETRGLLDMLVTAEGVVGVNDLKVSQRAAGTNGTVDVAAGWAIIQGDVQPQQGKYGCRSTAVENVAMPGTPGTGTRHHLLQAKVRDRKADGGSAYDWILDVKQDTGTGLPSVDPSAIPLAEVRRIAGQPSVLNTNITDLRKNARGLDASIFSDKQTPPLELVVKFITTDNNGYCFIPHNLKRQPVGAVITCNSPQGGVPNIPVMATAEPQLPSITSVRARIWSPTGAGGDKTIPYASRPVLLSAIFW